MRLSSVCNPVDSLIDVIGRLGIVDPDVVELSNLQRQVLHSEDTLSLPKVDSASIALKRYVSLFLTQ